MKTVKLSRSYTVHGGASDEIAFRPPIFNDIMEFGPPTAEGVMAGGVYLKNTNFEVVRQYAERLVQQPWNATLLSNLTAEDTFEVVNTILGFFQKPAASKSEPTTSSSGSDGTPAQSGK